MNEKTQSHDSIDYETNNSVVHNVAVRYVELIEEHAGEITGEPGIRDEDVSRVIYAIGGDMGHDGAAGYRDAVAYECNEYVLTDSVGNEDYVSEIIKREIAEERVIQVIEEDVGMDDIDMSRDELVSEYRNLVADNVFELMRELDYSDLPTGFPLVEFHD